ncbi:MAG: RNA-binding domain-containing protein [Fibrobacteria bacterium]
MKTTDERAFEIHVEEILLRGGWKTGAISEWDKANALFPARILAYIQGTQPVLWASMVTQHGAGLEALILKTLTQELETKGMLHVLRHGFKFYGRIFRMASFKPAHGLNYEILELYGKNELTVTRQVPWNPNPQSQGTPTLDMVLSLNGLPVATIELKNPLTDQTWRNAVNQYKTTRDPRAPLFKFKQRALVHFAADTDEVHMTTRLQEEKTFFLPFNRGSHPGEVKCGAGNPQHASGYRTAYFWEEVLGSESFLEILGNFMFLEKIDEEIEDDAGKRRVSKETLIFPRYHQLDALRKILASTRAERTGGRFLIQHSAGSGKTNSISWLSHRLSSLHDADDRKIFDCVIVITDRTVLDKQLQDAIYQIEHQQGVVKAIDDDSKQLANALVDGTKIVVTTLQKFPFVLRGLLHVAGAESQEKVTDEQKKEAKAWEALIASRRYAVIVDEAHSSQTGEAAREMKAILGDSGSSEDDEDWEDRLNRVMASRGEQSNLSFYAFTATPKGKTLEIFGRKQSSGTPAAFHTYSMRQAIEEGFILDTLQHYTSYETYFKLGKEIQDDPKFEKKKAARALVKFALLHPANIEQKTEVMVEHFRDKVKNLLGGRAKAMVVTSSRLHAVRYKLAFERYLSEKGYSDIRPLVAFSGKVKDPDITDSEYTEPGMNRDVVTGKPISEAQLPKRFASPDYQVLLVASKYQTGFDQPLLCAMYVDKRLDGVQAVQTLSRLNRKIPGKSEPFVLDFVNDRQDIYKAFKPYYDATSLQENSDPARLESLKHELEVFQVYHASEIEAFAKIFYRPRPLQSASDHARLQVNLQPAVVRFKAIEKEEIREDFRQKLKAFVSNYAFLTQILPYSDRELEMLYSFGRLLLPLLRSERGDLIQFEDEVSLNYYRLQLAASGEILVKEGPIEGVKSPTDMGTGKAKEKQAPLSEIIRVLNERFGTQFTDEDRLFFEQIKEKAVNNAKVIDTALANPFDKFKLGIKQLIESLMMQRLGENDEIVTRYMEDGTFQGAAFPILAKEIFDSIKANAGRKSIADVIAAGEGSSTEFKSTLRQNLHTKVPDAKMEHAALKSIAAFLNSREGGTLVIGVDDSGQALGLEADGFPNEDKLNLHLSNLIRARLGVATMLNVNPHFEGFQGKRVLVVDCLSSGVPVYLKTGSTEEFYIRAGASTASLTPSEMADYIKQRFVD